MVYTVPLICAWEPALHNDKSIMLYMDMCIIIRCLCIYMYSLGYIIVNNDLCLLMFMDFMLCT